MTLTPMLDSFVHACNKTRLQFETPFESLVEPKRRGLVAEMGFGVLREFVQSGVVYPYSAREIHPDTVVEVARRMAVRTQQPAEMFSHLSRREHMEALVLGHRLVDYVQPMSAEERIIIDVPLAGCGIVARLKQTFS